MSSRAESAAGCIFAWLVATVVMFCLAFAFKLGYEAARADWQRAAQDRGYGGHDRDGKWKWRKP